MSKLEKINLSFGFVGLLADLASLLAFVTGFVSFEEIVPPTMDYGAALFLYKVVSFLLLAYGWLIFSWYLTRRSLVLKRGRRTSLSERAARAVSGIGLFLIPITVSWLLFVSQPNDIVFIDAEQGKIAATLTPTLTPVPTNTPTSDTTLLPKTPTPNTSQGRPPSSGDVIFVTMFLGLLFGMPLLGLAIWGSIVLLMPLINVELLND